jgi:hypothetical protein
MDIGGLGDWPNWSIDQSYTTLERRSRTARGSSKLALVAILVDF